MKKIGVVLLVILTGLGIWYFGIKKDDYQITLQVKGTPQGTYYHILKWNNWGDLDNEKIFNTDSILFREVTKKFLLKDTVIQTKWVIHGINDSVTKVTVTARTGKHSLANRLAILTGETLFTRSFKEELKNFRSTVTSFSNTYRITIDGLVEVPALTCLYITDEALRNQKATKMIAANVDVYPTIREHRVEKDGFPFVKIQSWNMMNDKITFDFGFPIRKHDSLPIGGRIKYREFPSFKALKATFYGNYSKSDQAWFSLLNYAKKQNINVKNEPLEIFYDNPMQGGDDTEWKAEIFMPVVE